MANEATKRYDESSGYGGVIQDYTVSGSHAMEKGTLLQLFDPRYVSGSATAGCACAGILAREKVAGDGRSQVAVYKKGYFDMVASGTIAIGAPVMAHSVPNTVVAADVTLYSGACIIGYAEEAATNGETFMVRLDL